ncbi:MAG: FkbM family methyltransferase [Acidobacteria bacterium]|nr:FkbM family methyltransferase [Acidobacteriota bacterium]NIM60329.1 FkbM family methyltransferase [Acidobacteriota bacterium]NIO60330.1 FkbM family methyltransferase [Acidobacteriota bacterium]NIQ31385.1 FkbM family methyltransferase [Acidobacteriota bacterium]NIQ86611.1 FkbM family methyltransferase [Acidobacteriota bacterium]
MVRNVANWHEYLLHKTGIRKRDRFIFRLAHGIEADVPRAALFTFKELFFTDDYFRGLPQECFADGPLTVIDVGANVGYFSLYVFTRFPDARVIAFEPIDSNFRLLEANRKRNPSVDWTLVRQAVYSKTGPLVLTMAPEDEFTADATVFDNARGDKEVTVDAVSLAEALDANVVGAVDYLKLDIEGAEYDVLYGSPPELFERIRTIVIETHPGRAENQNKAALERYLSEVGYTTRTDSSPFIWAWR